MGTMKRKRRMNHEHVQRCLDEEEYVQCGELYFRPGKWQEASDVAGYNVELRDYFYVGKSRGFTNPVLDVSTIGYRPLTYIQPIDEDAYYQAFSKLMYDSALSRVGKELDIFEYPWKPSEERRQMLIHLSKQMEGSMSRILHGR